MNPKIIKLLKNLSTGLVVLAVVFAFLIAGIRVFGVQVFGVLTGSMEPTYPTGSLIYVKSVEASDLRVNDVITFSLSPNVIATHRIVEVVPDENNPSVVRFRTKGDANDEVDASLVSAGNIIGKVMFAVPQMGYLASYIQEPPGIYVAILVCGLMIAFVFYTDSLENGKKKGPAQNGANEKSGFDAVQLVNKLAVKVMGKPLIKTKNPQPKQQPQAAPFQQGYVSAQPQVQQPYGMYPQQPYAGQQNMYPQQGYPQMNQQPYYQQPQAAPFQQGYVPAQPQMQQPYGMYPQQPQQSMQQPVYPQQSYVQQPYGQPSVQYPQQPSYPVPQMQPRTPQANANAQPQQRRTRRTERT